MFILNKKINMKAATTVQNAFILIYFASVIISSSIMLALYTSIPNSHLTLLLNINFHRKWITIYMTRKELRYLEQDSELKIINEMN